MRKLQIIPLLAKVACCGLFIAGIAQQLLAGEESLLPPGKTWKLIWSDEFDGKELDASKWNFRLHFWGKRQPAFTDRAVELDGQGHLRIHLLKRADGSLCSSQLQTSGIVYDIPLEKPGGMWPFGKRLPTKFLHGFGYYEIRCRMNKNPDWWVAFWLQSPSIGAHPDARRAGVECDIMESQEYVKDGTIRCGNIWGAYGSDSKGSGHKHPTVFPTPDNWHRFGVDWSPAGYVFYIDGQEVNRVDTPVSETEQFLLISGEPFGYRPIKENMTPLSKEEAVTSVDDFEVDYVRVFDSSGAEKGSN